MALRTERLLLRPERMSDAPSVSAHFATPEVRRHLPLRGRATPAKIRAYLRRCIRQRRLKFPERFGFSIFVAGRWAGRVHLDFPSKGVGDIGYSLNPDFWGKGYATEAAGRVLEWAFATRGLHRIQASCAVANRASAKVVEHLGMRREGRMRGYLMIRGRPTDLYMYGITRPEWAARQTARLKSEG